MTGPEHKFLTPDYFDQMKFFSEFSLFPPYFSALLLAGVWLLLWNVIDPNYHKNNKIISLYSSLSRRSGPTCLPGCSHP